MIRLILFIVVSVTMIGGTSMAENLSTCNVDTVPIQIFSTWGGEPVTTLSAAKKSFSSGEPNFNAFVTSVTEHLAAKLAQENLCLSSAESKKRSLLKFAFLPGDIAGTDNSTQSLVQPLEVKSLGVCRISSPWIDIAIEREPVPSVQAIVRFSERQLLADQAVLAGARDVPPGVAMPMARGEFSQYTSAYRKSNLFPAYGTPPQEKPIEELVPPDILWLLNRTRQSNEPPFSHSASLAMRDALDWGTEGYTKIAIAMIDQCFSSGGVDMQYNSVLDVADLVSLEQYKLVMPIIGRAPVR